MCTYMHGVPFFLFSLGGGEGWRVEGRPKCLIIDQCKAGYAFLDTNAMCTVNVAYKRSV